MSALRRPFIASLSLLLDRLAPSAELARAARRYADRFEGVNDDDPTSNGEHWLIERALVDPAPIVFDVGANEGAWADVVLALRPGAMVHCFEPSAATFALLSSRIGSRAQLNRTALGSNAGVATLHVVGDGSGMNSLHRREGLEAGWGIGAPKRTEAVPLETLDRYCRTAGVTSIALLKIDVEGSEVEVLRGADGLLRGKAIDAVQFEYGGCNIDSRVLLKDLFAVLGAHGYRLFRLLPRGIRSYPRYDQRAEDFQHANWVALAPHVDATRFGVVDQAARSA